MPGPKISDNSLQEWEDAGTTFANALDKYLCSCLALRSKPLSDVTFLKLLATRIDSALDSFNATLDHQISQAKATLALTRNKILSPTYHLPEEVLTEIFSHVVYIRPDPDQPVPMADSLVQIYRSLYNLIGVCSAWKNAALARGSFWSTIPIVSSNPSHPRLRCPQAMQLSLDRAGSADLHLAAMLPHWPRNHPALDAITKHASQFRTLNISSSCYCVVSDILSIFGGLGSSSRISELHVQRKREKSSRETLPSKFDYIIEATSSDRAGFDQLLARLSVFRLCGAPIHWDQVAFSNQLVELELQEFTMGFDLEIDKMLTALSSATELRHLKFISIITFPAHDESDTSDSKIAFPKLQTLLVRDLYVNTLDRLLSSVASCAHQVTLQLTEKAFRHVHPGAPESPECDTNDLFQLLSRLPVTTLLIDGEKDNNWMSAEDFRELITSLPDLETLGINFWVFDDNLCEALSRPSNNDSSPFPHIKNIHFISAKVWDFEPFTAMVASHSGILERMELRVNVRVHAGTGSDGDSISDWGSVDEDDYFPSCLQDIVPDLQLELTEYDGDSKEFRSPEWQL
ncbi:unnamed protein product, partial [Rhizoctonia solani]